MEITINNQLQELEGPVSVLSVLNDFVGIQHKGIAVAINETVIPKADWASHLLQANDRLLVIKATQGG